MSSRVELTRRRFEAGRNAKIVMLGVARALNDSSVDLSISISRASSQPNHSHFESRQLCKMIAVLMLYCELSIFLPKRLPSEDGVVKSVADSCATRPPSIEVAGRLSPKLKNFLNALGNEARLIAESVDFDAGVYFVNCDSCRVSSPFDQGRQSRLMSRTRLSHGGPGSFPAKNNYWSPHILDALLQPTQRRSRPQRTDHRPPSAGKDAVVATLVPDQASVLGDGDGRHRHSFLHTIDGNPFDAAACGECIRSSSTDLTRLMIQLKKMLTLEMTALSPDARRSRTV